MLVINKEQAREMVKQVSGQDIGLALVFECTTNMFSDGWNFTVADCRPLGTKVLACALYDKNQAQRLRFNIQL